MKPRFDFYILTTSKKPLCRIVYDPTGDPDQSNKRTDLNLKSKGTKPKLTIAYLVALLLTTRVKRNLRNGDLSDVIGLDLANSPSKGSDWIKTLRVGWLQGVRQYTVYADSKSDKKIPKSLARVPNWYEQIRRVQPHCNCNFFSYPPDEHGEKRILLGEAWEMMDIKVFLIKEADDNAEIDLSKADGDTILKVAEDLLNLKKTFWQPKHRNIKLFIEKSDMKNKDRLKESNERSKAQGKKPRSAPSLLDLEHARLVNSNYPLPDAPLATPTEVPNVRSMPIHEQFDHYAKLFSYVLEGGRWFQLLNDQTLPDFQSAFLTAQIGFLHRQKEVGLVQCAPRTIPGDDKGLHPYLFEATWQVLWHAEQTFPEINKACLFLVEALKFHEENEAVLGHPDKEFRNFEHLLLLFRPDHLYLFLLWFTYTVIENKNANFISNTDRLIKRSHLFYLLMYYHGGVNYRFLEFHGDPAFSRPSKPFTNIYWQTDIVQKDDTLMTICKRNYKNAFASDEQFIAGLIKANGFPENSDPNMLLNEIPNAPRLKALRIGPPTRQMSKYQETMNSVKPWLETVAGKKVLEIPPQPVAWNENIVKFSGQ